MYCTQIEINTLQTNKQTNTTKGNFIDDSFSLKRIMEYKNRQVLESFMQIHVPADNVAVVSYPVITAP